MLTENERSDFGNRYGHKILEQEKNFLRYGSEPQGPMHTADFVKAICRLNDNPFGKSQRVHTNDDIIKHTKDANEILKPLGFRASAVPVHAFGVPSTVNFALYKNQRGSLPKPFCLMNWGERVFIGGMEATLKNIEDGPETIWSSQKWEFNQAFDIMTEFNVPVFLARKLLCGSVLGYPIYPGFNRDIEWEYDVRKRDAESRSGVVTDPEKVNLLPIKDWDGLPPILKFFGRWHDEIYWR